MYFGGIYNLQLQCNLICFKGCNIHKELIRCIRITATSKPPESRAGGVPVFVVFLGGGGGIFVEGSVIIFPIKNGQF